MTPAEEHWRPVPGAVGFYEVSNLGRVRNLRRLGTRGGVIVSTVHPRTGHRQVRLCVAGRQWKVALHALVLEAFVGPRPPGMVCRHLDGDTSNNAVANLAWGTPSENVADMIRHGNHPQLNKTHCPQGHLYDEANTYHRSDSRGGRNCRTCGRLRKAARRKEVAADG